MISSVSMGANPVFQSVSSTISEITKKVIDWSIAHFSLIEGVGFFFYGLKELLFDGIYVDKKIKPLDQDATSTERKVFLIRKKMSYMFKIHGGLYTASAVGYTSKDLGLTFPGVHLCSDGLFLFANLLGLSYYVDLYQQTASLPDKLAKKFKVAAVLGILNSIGYILAAATVLLGGMAALALVFGGVALAFGGIKVLYDFFYVTTRRP